MDNLRWTLVGDVTDLPKQPKKLHFRVGRPDGEFIYFSATKLELTDMIYKLESVLGRYDE